MFMNIKIGRVKNFIVYPSFDELDIFYSLIHNIPEEMEIKVNNAPMRNADILT